VAARSATRARSTARKLGVPKDADSPTFGLVVMKAKLGELPIGDEWAYEIKWDGVRALARIDKAGLTLTTRTGNDITARYPELKVLEGALDRRKYPILLDGEIVAFDENGKPSFSALQPRMHLTRTAQVDSLSASAPVTFAVFDLLVSNGELLTDLTYTQRRAALAALKIDEPSVSVPRAYDNGEALLREMISSGMEGVVAKRRESTYRKGRSSDWIKVKHKPRQEFVIGGWTEGAGRREGSFGALLLGYYDEDGNFAYAGNVGSGFNDRLLGDLHAGLEAIESADSPFNGPVAGQAIHFAEPEFVAEIEYAELTPDIHLRQPVFKGLRDDKSPKDVVLERTGK
jgi:bifunctional non-homologous end joining protein LigD